MRPNDSVLIEQGQLALDLEDALDDEHYVRPARVVLVEADRYRVLQRPRQDAFAEFGDLLVVAQHDRVLADEVDAADVAVEIDADARPVEPRGNLLDMRRFAGAVIAADHDATVEGEAGEDRQRRVVIEAIRVVEIGHIFARLAERRNFEIGVDPEGLAHGNLDVGLAGWSRGCRRFLNGWHSLRAF